MRLGGPIAVLRGRVLVSLVLPLLRFVLAALLLRVISRVGGYSYLDTLALATSAVSLISVLAVPAVVRIRSVARESLVLEACDEQGEGVLKDAGIVFWQMLFLCLITSLLFFLCGVLDESQASFFLLVTLVSGLSTSLIGVEHLAGGVGVTTRLRVVELLLFLVFAGVALAFESAAVAVCSAVMSTGAARLMLIRANPLRVAKVFGSLLVTASNFLSYWRWCTSQGRSVMAANALQASSAFLMNAVAMAILPAGILGQIALAYRFAGPMQLVSSQLSYSTWGAGDVKAGYILMLLVAAAAAAFSIVLPSVVGRFLGLETGDGLVVVGFVAVCHLLIQGVCQIRGAMLYNHRDYNGLLLAALPHVVVAVGFSIWLTHTASAPLWGVILWLAFPSLLELLVLKQRARSDRSA